MRIASSEKKALACHDLSIGYCVGPSVLNVVRNVSLDVKPGEALGIVGESGSGKSTLALALANCMSPNAVTTSGEIQIDGASVSSRLTTRARRDLVKRLSVVFQNPASALDPGRHIGSVFDERLRVLGVTSRLRSARAMELLESVKIRNAAQVLASYPHQLSGGMQQRVVIALAIANDPAVLVLDEPTTGLDATVASEIIELLMTLRQERRAGIVFISHDIGQVHSLCDDIAVMYGGEIVEYGRAGDIVSHPRHPYTRALLACLPSIEERRKLRGIQGAPPSPTELGLLKGCLFGPRCEFTTEICKSERPKVTTDATHYLCHHSNFGTLATAVVAGGEQPTTHTSDVRLKVDGLQISYGRGNRERRILEDVSFELRPGEILAIVGESGSGKSTLLRGIAGLIAPNAGAVMMNGKTLSPYYGDRTREALSDIRIVFQNPSSALNRRRRVGDQIRRSLALSSGRPPTADDVDVQAERVRLPLYNLKNLARSLSGGLLQRVAIACALSGRPQVLLFDEPTSALDVSVQADILNLIVEQIKKTNAAAIFVTHDLAVVRQVADRALVLLNGTVVESGDVKQVFEHAKHSYTKRLLSAFKQKSQGIKPQVDSTDATELG